MSYTVIIPARFASTRLPGKPLAKIGNKPMIQHVYERAKQSQASRIVVATDDQRVFDAVQSFGGEVVMTAVTHESGSDRLNEAATKLGLSASEIIVNVQGDEPLIPAVVIDQVAQNLAMRESYNMATLSSELLPEQLFESSVVKVVADKNGRALYFSRAPIPFSRKDFPQTPSDVSMWRRHIGIYAYRVKFLQQFVQWAPAPIEQCESLEQLRAMWNGEAIHIELAKETPPAGVDTPEDLQRVQSLLTS